MDERPELWKPLVTWLNLHPEYRRQFESTVNQMMYDVDGPLPLHHRQYLALMAASRHRCKYLVDLHKSEFLRFGGDPTWVEHGLTAAGSKLAQMDTLNRLLAHQPWMLQSHHLKDITRCESGMADAGNLVWSLSEMVHAAVILCHTHALCSFIIGSGINYGCESPLVNRPAGDRVSESCTFDSATQFESAEERAENEVQMLMKRMAEMSTQADVNAEELAKQFMDINIQSSELEGNTLSSTTTHTTTTSPSTTTPSTTSPSRGHVTTACNIAPAAQSTQLLNKHAGIAATDHDRSKTKSPTKDKEKPFVATSRPYRSLSGKKSLEADLGASYDCTGLASQESSPLDESLPNVPTNGSTPTDFSDVKPNGVCLGSGSTPPDSPLRSPRMHSGSMSPRGKFTSDVLFSYVDFASRNAPSQTPTLKIHDYSWDDQGYSVVSQLYHQLGDHLESKFQLTQSLTYNTMGEHEGVDTSKYRQAIWNYIQSLYGIRHDDYNYAEVNLLLSIPMKTYIKTMACFPERTTLALRESVMQDFKYSEKVHVNVLVAEGRLQAELLYFLRAVTRLMIQ